MRSAAALVALLALSACAQRDPPQELAGLWSAGPAACEAGVGLEFQKDAVSAVYADSREILFDKPRYTASHAGGRFSVRIDYELPPAPGAKAADAQRGVLVFQRRDDGWLTPVAHRLEDRRTGSVRVRIGQDPAALALTVRPCAANAWIGALRGRAAR